MCVSLSLASMFIVAVSLSHVCQICHLNNVCVLHVGVCVGVPQAFVRILGGCVLT